MAKHCIQDLSHIYDVIIHLHQCSKAMVLLAFCSYLAITKTPNKLYFP